MHHSQLVLALASVALAAPAPATDTTKIPFQRRTVTNADGSVNGEALRARLSSTLAKYGHAVSLEQPERGRSKRATSNIPLTSNVFNVANASVGRTDFQLEFDTGVADLFVPGSSCSSANGCNGTAKYQNTGQDQHKSTTVMYGSSQVSGEDYKDSVTVGGLTVPAQGFISMTDASGIAGSGFSGVLGMAFSTIAQTGYPTFVENLIAQGSLTSPQFAFYLGRQESHTLGASELTIGGADKSRYCAPVTKVPVTTKGYWQVALDGVLVNGQNAGPTTKGQAAIDTGTTMILAPSAAASAIFAKIPGAVPLPGLSGGASITFWGYPCTTSAKYIPVLQFAGKRFAINPKDFNLGNLARELSVFGGPDSFPGFGGQGTLCLAGLASADIDSTQNLYIVGDVFLKNWYSIYNYADPSVSFAPAINNNPQA